mgnify:CR=1 FL=1
MEKKNKYTGTQTEKNLQAAFAGESQARNRYTLFAEVAKREGYEQIMGIFAETAEQELAHATRFFKLMTGGGMVGITAEYPAGRIGTTTENLLEAAEGQIVVPREHGELAVLLVEIVVVDHRARVAVAVHHEIVDDEIAQHRVTSTKEK